MVLGIVCGAAMLVTFLIPWAAGARRFYGGVEVVMSWDLLSRAPGEAVAWFVTSWVVGAGAIVISAILRGQVLGIIQASLGFIAMVMLFIGITGVPGVGASLGMGGSPVLTILTLLALMVMLVGNPLTVRFPGRLVGRLIGGIGGGILAVLELVSMIMVLSSLGMGVRGLGVLFLIVMLLATLALIAAGILSAINIAPLRSGKALGRVSLILAYTGLGLLALFILVMPAVMSEEGGMLLSALNALILMACPFFLLGGGGVTLATALLSRAPAGPRPAAQPAYAGAPPFAPAPVPPPAPAPAPAEPTDQLKRLKDLFDKGLITEEEYNLKRKQVLDRMV